MCIKNESYIQMETRHQKEFANFPMFFAFNDEQFKEGMESFGFTLEDKDKIYRNSTGGFYKKTDAKALSELINRMTKESEDAVKNDLTGEGYIFEMFSYELSNHEYCYTGDITDAIEALGVTMEEINNSPALLKGLRMAILEQREE